MATLTVTVPNAIATELNTIAQENGFPNAKDMLIAYVRAEIRAYRGNKALGGVREAAEDQADQDTAAMS